MTSHKNILWKHEFKYHEYFSNNCWIVSENRCNYPVPITMLVALDNVESLHGHIAAPGAPV